MIALAKPVRSRKPSLSQYEKRFLEFVPTIRSYAQRAFCRLDAEAREDAISESIANAYVAFVSLVTRGKADRAFPTVLAKFAISQIRGGRRVGSRCSTRDVLSPAAQRRHGFGVEPFIGLDTTTGDWVEAVVGDTATPVADQAAFRCDFPEWLAKLTPRTRRIAEALSLGNSTVDVARRFNVSSARVSQMRAELHDSWLAFHGE